MYKKIKLKNGITLIYENIDYVKSVSLGVWIGSGSRNETELNNGVSHFIEHMLFKGTQKRTAKEIAQSIENIGGQINAFTGKECTCFYTKTLDTDIELAIDILSDIIINSKFDQKHIDTERKVIIEEIGMYEDFPEEMVFDIICEEVYKNNSLGYQILGTKKSLDKIDREIMIDYLNKNYTPENCVISVAGHFDEDNLIDLLNRYFSSWETRQYTKNVNTKPIFRPSFIAKKKDTEQVHLCITYEGIKHGLEELYSLLAFNNYIGGGMGSVLFQKIREEEGLAYSIYSFLASYMDTGLFAIYAATSKQKLTEVLKHITEEFNYALEKGIPQDEIEKVKAQMKGNYILGLENTSNIMNGLGKSQLMIGRTKTLDQVINSIDSITTQSVQKVVSDVLLTAQNSLALIGKVKAENKYYEIIKKG